MTGHEKSPRGQPGAGRVPFGTTGTILSYHDLSPPVKLDYAHLLDLATQALAKAERCAILWQACRAAGDQAGAVVWRKRQLAHQAVAWAATHPPIPFWR